MAGLGADFHPGRPQGGILCFRNENSKVLSFC